MSEDSPIDIPEEGIVCRASTLSKSVFPTAMAIFAGAMLIGVVPSNWLLWLLWALLIPYMLTYSPDFTVHDDGIAVHFPWKTAFNPWDKVVKVRKTAINMRIYARNLTLANVLFSFGNPWIVATAPGRSNYEEAVAAIQSRVGDRFHSIRY